MRSSTSSSGSSGSSPSGRRLGSGVGWLTPSSLDLGGGAPILVAASPSSSVRACHRALSLCSKLSIPSSTAVKACSILGHSVLMRRRDHVQRRGGGRRGLGCRGLLCGKV